MMGSKTKMDPRSGEVLPKKKHSKIDISSAISTPDDTSLKKKKKHLKNKEPSDSDFVSIPKMKHNDISVVQAEAPKKKKKLKLEKVEPPPVAIIKSPKKHSKPEETPPQLASTTKSPKKRSRMEKESEIPESPRKKHKKSVNAMEDNMGRDSDSPSEKISLVKEFRPDGAAEKKKSNTVELWPTEDMNSLFSRMRSAIPKDDKLSFHTRQEKIDWNSIAFGEYSGEDCKSMWLQVTRQLRGFRLLSELIDDAAVWVGKPWTKFGKKESKRHPDEPQRPLNAYMLHYMAVKAKVQAQNPGMPMGELTKLIANKFKALPPAERKKYEDLALEKKKEYLENMKTFEKNHPEVVTSHKFGPKKSRTPLQLFSEERFKKYANSGLSPQQIREEVKEKWKSLSDKKRIKWIKKAVAEHKIYQEELKQYLAIHPDFKPDNKKSAVLNRKELDLLLKAAGRPEKPPSSSLRVFVRDQYHAEISKGALPDDVFAILNARWKAMSTNDKQVYVDRFAKETAQYKKDYEAYINSLSDEQKEYEELATQTVKPVKKKKDKETPAEEEVVVKATEKPSFPGEPQKPPSSAFELFVLSFVKDSGLKAEDAQAYWDYLPDSDKEKFRAKQTEMMEKYMVKFERFLKSLDKEQLDAYKKLHRGSFEDEGKTSGSVHNKKSREDPKNDSSESDSDSSESEDEEEESSSSESEQEQVQEAPKDSSEDSEDDSSSSDEVQMERINNNVVIKKPPVSSSDDDSDSD